MRELSTLQVNTGSTFEGFCPFPVGYIYQSTNNTSPADLYGGTWAPLTDGRFLRPNGSWNSTGGADSVSHKHWMPGGMEGFSGGNFCWRNGDVLPADISVRGYQNQWHSIYSREMETSTSNGTENSTYSETISIVPSFRTCYAWYRTA